MTVNLSRRNFLRGAATLGAAAAAGFVLRDGLLVPEEEKQVRRYWQVGTNLQRGAGLEPIPGQPGLFRDRATNNLVALRDFSEADKFDSVTVPYEEFIEGTEPSDAPPVVKPTKEEVEAILQKGSPDFRAAVMGMGAMLGAMSYMIGKQEGE